MNRKSQIEYIWLDSEQNFRSKVRYLDSSLITINNIPLWNFDGSSTGQAETHNSEVLLEPVRLYKDSQKYYVLCETMLYDTSHNLIPHPSNTRNKLRHIDDDFWFGFEQEFFIKHVREGFLHFFPECMPQGPYYCNIQPVHGVSDPHIVRKMTELIAQRCIALDLGITGWNLEVAPGQTEIQIFGHGLKAADDLMMMRYLAYTTLSEHNLCPVFDPKPLGPSMNGSGLHTNVSTSNTRNPGGFKHIRELMDALAATHAAHIADYGTDNHLRLTGKHETSSMTAFSWGVGSRDTSVRIPNQVAADGCGYFEDRRPAANADPYKIVTRLIQTIAPVQ